MEEQHYKCKFCEFLTSENKRLFPHAVSHNEHLDISNFKTSFSAYFEPISIRYRTLDYFKPFESKRDVTDLVNYLVSIDSAHRFTLKECAIVIEDFRLLEYFFRKCIQRNLFPRGEEYISKVVAAINSLNFQEAQNLIWDLDDVKKRQRIRYTPPKPQSLPKSQEAPTACTPAIEQPKVESDTGSESDPDLIGEVKISEIHFEVGKIKYKKHILVNSRIVPLTKSVRKSITQTFRIVRDKTTKNHFVFDPVEDLSIILDACDESKRQKAQTEKKSKLNSGTANIPWRAVTFHDYRLSVMNVFGGSNRTPFIYHHTQISKSFNKIIKYIERACPQLTATLRDGNIIGIHGVDKLISLIPKLTHKTLYDEEDYAISTSKRRTLYPGNSYSLNDLKGRREFSKSSYLTYLSERHHVDFKVYYLLESVNHMSNECSRDEYGFLFTLSQNSRRTILIFENMTDESRASIVFSVSTPLISEGINQIKKFLGGDLVNKRQKLAYGQVIFKSAAIINVSRILHTDMYSWRYNVNSYK